MNPVHQMKQELPARLREYAALTSPATPHRVTLGAAADEIEHLRRTVQWCRMRLLKPAYRDTLDKILASPVFPDDATIRQSDLDARRDSTEHFDGGRCG